MKKFLLYILILVVLIGLSSPITKLAALVGPPLPVNFTYQPLAHLPGMENTINVSDTGGIDALGAYLNVIVTIFIGICAVLAVVMIVIGGMQYMTSELISSKEAGKEKIRNAIFGLLLALGAWLILNTINPALLQTAPLKNSLTQQTITEDVSYEIKEYTGQGTCTPATSGPCSPSNLAGSGFTDSTQASSICNAESRGDPNLESGVDKCSDGSSFSFGLFQVNAIAHASEIPACNNVFATNGGGTQGACLQRDPSGAICIEHDCHVTNQANFASCKSYLKGPTNNIAFAAGLESSSGWGQWGANASCHF